MKNITLILIIALAMAAALLPANASTQQNESAEVLLGAALHQQEVEGNLEAAIKTYQEVLAEHPDNRPIAARALVQMGRCYEKLGLTDAREVYQRVIDNFPDQREEVATARQRLASLTEELAELRRQPTFTKIEIASKPWNGVLSPDGTRLAFVSKGGVWVVPLQGNVGPNIAGEPVRIADVPDAWDAGSLFSWSAD